ncbi:MAG: hypothetical protein IJ743_00580 [Bacilli bacterium]|nr:hypothetical protein [Methanobrevibacter sp.]MBR1748271.1 hypothetical protein [Bacilli bacterium]
MSKLNSLEADKLDNTCGNLRATKLGTHVKSLEDFVNEGVLATRANDVTGAINELYEMFVNKDCSSIQIPPPGFFTIWGNDEDGKLYCYYNDEDHPPVFRHIEDESDDLNGTLYLYIADPEGDNHYEMEIGQYIAVRHLNDYYTKTEINTLLTQKNVTVTKQATADSGYAATYIVKQNGTQVGAKINIPKDFLVKSGELKTCTAVNQPVQGYTVGDKYLDFVVNTVDSSESAQHIYILVKDLVDVYTAGTGLTLSNSGVFNHSNSVTAQTSAALKKIKFDAQGHITGTGNVSASDLPDSTAHDNIGSAANASQAAINTSIDAIIGGLNESLTDIVAGDLDLTGYVKDNDSRLSDARTPTSHTHGNITNDGKVGTAANKPLITGTGGVVGAGSFEGTATNIKMNGVQSVGSLNTFARGDHVHPVDTSRAAASHTHNKLDIISQLPANSDLNDYKTIGMYTCSKTNSGTLSNRPVTGSYACIIENKEFTTNVIIQFVYRVTTSVANNDIYYRVYTGSAWTAWQKIYTNNNIPSASTSQAGIIQIGTTATTAASGNHAHGNITNAGAIGSTANKPIITTTSGKLTTGAFGTAANTFCQGNDPRLSDARTPLAHTHTDFERFTIDTNVFLDVNWETGIAVFRWWKNNFATTGDSFWDPKWLLTIDGGLSIGCSTGYIYASGSVAIDPQLYVWMRVNPHGTIDLYSENAAAQQIWMKPGQIVFPFYLIEG